MESIFLVLSSKSYFVKHITGFILLYSIILIILSNKLLENKGSMQLVKITAISMLHTGGLTK